MHTKLASPKFGMGSVTHYGRIALLRLKLLSLPSYKCNLLSRHIYGHKNPELIRLDNWNMDFRFMERPSARQVQMDLFYDYRNNVALYAQWQKFLRERHPDTLIFWGQNDIFFTPKEVRLICEIYQMLKCIASIHTILPWSYHRI